MDNNSLDNSLDNSLVNSLVNQNPDSVKDSVTGNEQTFWQKYGKWIIGFGIFLVVAAVIVGIVALIVYNIRKKKNKSKQQSNQSISGGSTLETFISSDDLSENGFVNSYIASSIGNFV